MKRFIKLFLALASLAGVAFWLGYNVGYNSALLEMLRRRFASMGAAMRSATGRAASDGE